MEASLSTALSDDSIAIVGSFCANADLVVAGSVGSQWLRVLRSNRVWLTRQVRWSFGSIAPLIPLALPGARADAVQRSVAASTTSMSRDAFDFFLHRSRIDLQISYLLGQYATIAARIEASAAELRAPSDDAHAALEAELAIVAEAQANEMRVDQMKRLCADILAFGSDAIDALICSTKASITGTVLPDGPRIESGVQPIRSCCQRTAAQLLQSALRAWAVSKWELLLRDPERNELLEEGALILSQWSAPAKPVDSVRAVLSAVADRAALELAQNGGARPSALDKTVALNKAFVAARFTGNAADYYAESNSYLHWVCEKRMGIPISLSILYVAVARRFGLRAHVLAGFPQHVIVRVETGAAPQTPWTKGDDATVAIAAKDLYVDPFNGFFLLKWPELAPRFRLRVSPSRLSELVRAVDPPDVYLRLLNNVVHCARANRRDPRDTVGGHPRALYVITACLVQMSAIEMFRADVLSGERQPTLGDSYQEMESRLARLLPHAELGTS